MLFYLVWAWSDSWASQITATSLKLPHSSILTACLPSTSLKGPYVVEVQGQWLTSKGRVLSLPRALDGLCLESRFSFAQASLSAWLFSLVNLQWPLDQLRMSVIPNRDDFRAGIGGGYLDSKHSDSVQDQSLQARSLLHRGENLQPRTALQKTDIILRDKSCIAK